MLVDDDFFVFVNAWWEPLAFTLPDTRPDAVWRLKIDTYDPGSVAEASDRGVGDSITVGPRSVAILASPRPSLRTNRFRPTVGVQWWAPGGATSRSG